MPWQTQAVVQLLAGNTIINANGDFVYSAAPATGNLATSNAPLGGVDTFGNHYLPGVCSYGPSLATQVTTGIITLLTGSLAAGWTAKVIIETDAGGDLILQQAAGHAVLTNNNTLDDGSGNATISGTLSVNGSTSTGPGDNGGVTSGPSGTVNAFPAAGPSHTHAEIHHHPL